MKEQDSRSKNSTGCVGAAVVSLLMLPIAYVLSCGPAVRLHMQGMISEEMLNSVYMPLIWLAENSSAFNWLVEWYVELWM